MTVERKYERDIDLLLAEEFEVSPLFASWFLRRTKKFSGAQASVSRVWVSKSDNIGESDLVVLFDEAGDSKRFALHIEDKVNAPLQPEQVARYRLELTERFVMASTRNTRLYSARPKDTVPDVERK